jgi:tRNA A-37 threonylcarbamoyl transferase component Bud32
VPASPPEPLLDGRYRLADLVGEGGMARVYRAEDVVLGRTVAVKLLRPGVEGTASPERARAEVAALAALSHPALVMLLDASLEPGKPEYLVMEFIDGETLATALKAGPLPAAEVAALAAELAEALHVVHSAGVVHRDLKPANILVTPSPLPYRRFRAKLADFGIAYLLDSARITTPGMVIGTASYLAPEQVRGADPAPPADIYAFGLVLIEALTGTRPFPAASAAEAALARLGAPPVIPPTVGTAWRGLLERMTALDPLRRPTALEVAIAAGDIAGAAPLDTPTAVLPPVVAPSPRSGEEPTVVLASAGASAPPAPRRRARAVLWTAAAGGALAVGLGAWAVVGASTAQPAPAATTPAANDPIEDPATTPTPSDPGVAPAVEQPAGPAAPADDDAQRDAEKAQRDAEKEAEKARKEAEKEAERAREEAEERDG